jgi:hypothetical protein
MSSGSIVAIGTFAKGSRTTSPASSWPLHRNVFDMKVFGCRNVQASPLARTASSERM